MNNKERMLKGLIYDPTGPDIMTDQIKCLSLLYKFNKTKPTQLKRREKLLKKMFGSIGEGCYIEPPLRANWGGKHVFFGNKVYANFNLTLVDDGNIYVGDCTKFGPNVTVATPNHPLLPELRDKMYQYNKDIHIGKTVWIGSNVTIVPGVTIGNNSVIGAGSVVTKDIPEGVLAYGVPAKVIRKIDEHDKEFFYKNEKIDWDNLK